MFVMSVHTGQVPVQRMLVLMSNIILIITLSTDLYICYVCSKRTGTFTETDCYNE
jgi:hypothetical protein